MDRTLRLPSLHKVLGQLCSNGCAPSPVRHFQAPAKALVQAQALAFTQALVSHPLVE